MATSDKPGSDSDQRWLDVLAGRAAPSDSDTQVAAALRDAHEHAVEQALASRPDPQQVKVLVNLLMAERAAERRAAPAPRIQPLAAAAAPLGPWARLREWLSPSAPNASWRYGALAAGVLGIAVLPNLVEPPTGDNPDTIKALPGGEPGASGVAGAPQVVLLPAGVSPTAQAAAVQAVLLERGIPALLVALGDAVRVQAQIPAAERAAVARALAQQGITWREAPVLSLELQAAR